MPPSTDCSATRSCGGVRENSGLRVSDDESVCARDTEGPFSYCRSGCAEASTGHPGRVRQEQAYHPTPSLLGIPRNASPLSGHRQALCQQGLWVSVNKLWIARHILCTGWGQPCGQGNISSTNQRLTCDDIVHGLWTEIGGETSVIHRTAVDRTAAGVVSVAWPHIYLQCHPRKTHRSGKFRAGAGHIPRSVLSEPVRTGWVESRAGMDPEPERETCSRANGRKRPETARSPRRDGGGSLMDPVTLVRRC